MAACVAACAALSACARPVEVSPPEAAPDISSACARFTAALPQEIDTAGDLRDTTPESDLTAAYGDPPVGIRCGVPTPTTLAPTSTLVRIDEIDWYPEELTAGWRLTSVGRQANVEITVPDELGPAPSVAADLSPTIEATIPPSG